MSAGASPVLWHYPFSNFNEKARWALDFKQVPHERRSLMPGGARAMYFSFRGTVPVLELDGRRIADSTQIIEALEQIKPEPALYPDDPDQRRRALELEEFFDEHAGHELRRAAFYELREEPAYTAELLATGRSGTVRATLRTMLPLAMTYARRRYRIYPEDARVARKDVEAALDRLVSELQPSGYLVGERFGVADLTAAALLFPLADPPELQYPFPSHTPDALASWFRALSGHPAVAWIGRMYREHRGSSMGQVRPHSSRAAQRREPA
jgi:glutathione S-transferase